MTEDFVPCELAVKLKEKGYPQHIADDAYIVDNYGEEDYQIGDILPIPLIPDYIDDVSAPRIDQVLKWLREKHNIHISVTIGCDADKDSVDCIFYWAGIAKFNNVLGVDYIDPFDDKEFSSNEEAVEAALRYSLENLI